MARERQNVGTCGGPKGHLECATGLPNAEESLYKAWLFKFMLTVSLLCSTFLDSSPVPSEENPDSSLVRAFPSGSPVPGRAFLLHSCSLPPTVPSTLSLLSRLRPAALAASIGCRGAGLRGGRLQGSSFCPQGLALRPRDAPGTGLAAGPQLPWFFPSSHRL